MNTEKRIRVFYILSMLGIVIGMVSSGLSLVSFDGTEYGIYNLFVTFITQLGILSFGYQDGMLINYRKKEYDQLLPTLIRDLKFGTIFQFVILIVTIILIPIIMQSSGSNGNVVFTMILALIYTLPNALLGNIRNAFSSLGRFDIIGYFDFIIKVYLFGSLLLVSFCGIDVYTYIIIDIILKSIIVIGLYIMIYRNYKQVYPEGNIDCNYTFSIKDNFKKGLLILIGNWSYVLIFSIDKSMLANHEQMLGIYSYAMFILTSIYQLITPIKSVIISQIDEKVDIKQVCYNTIKLTLAIAIIGYLYLVVGQNILVWVAQSILKNFPGLLAGGQAIVDGLKWSGIISIVLPLYICINIYFMSLLVTKNQKDYAIYGTINAIGSIIIYVICLHLVADPLWAVVLGTLINYIFTYLFNGVVLTNWHYLIKFILCLIPIIVGAVIIIFVNNLILNWLIIGVTCFVFFKFFRSKSRGEEC